MEVHNNDNDFELGYYFKIIEHFQTKQNNREKRDKCKHQLLIKLMELLENTENTTLVRNALILIITLFENIPPDLFNNRGVNINRLSKKDRSFLISELKEEFLPN